MLDQKINTFYVSLVKIGSVAKKLELTVPRQFVKTRFWVQMKRIFHTNNQNRFVLQSLHIFSLNLSKCESVKRTRPKYFKIQKQYQQGVFQPRKQIPSRSSSCEDGHWAEPWICPVRSSSPALWLPSERRSRRHALRPNPVHSWLGQPQSLQVEGTYK